MLTLRCSFRLALLRTRLLALWFCLLTAGLAPLGRCLLPLRDRLRLALVGAGRLRALRMSLLPRTRLSPLGSGLWNGLASRRRICFPVRSFLPRRASQFWLGGPPLSLRGRLTRLGRLLPTLDVWNVRASFSWLPFAACSLLVITSCAGIDVALRHQDVL